MIVSRGAQNSAARIKDSNTSVWGFGVRVLSVLGSFLCSTTCLSTGTFYKYEGFTDDGGSGRGERHVGRSLPGHGAGDAGPIGTTTCPFFPRLAPELSWCVTL